VYYRVTYYKKKCQSDRVGAGRMIPKQAWLPRNSGRNLSAIGIELLISKMGTAIRPFWHPINKIFSTIRMTTMLKESDLLLPTRIPRLALTVALLLGYLSVLPYFGLQFEYIPGDLGDNRLVNYLLEHGYKWITGQAPESFFDAPFYFPARESLRYSENLLGSVPFYVPWRLLGFSRETAFQIWILLGYLLNFMAAAWVLHKLRFHWFAVLAGAYVFAFSQAVLTHSWHIQLHYRFAIPLSWYFLYLFLERFSTKHFLGCLSFLAWQFYCGVYPGYFLSLFLAAFVVVTAVRKPVLAGHMQSLTLRSVAAQLLILVAFGICMAVLVLGYLRSVADPQLMEARREEVLTMLPRPVSYFVGYLGSSETGWLYDRIDLPMKHEHVMFVGLIPWIAVLTLLCTAKRPGRHPAVMPALAAMFLIIGLTLYLGGFSLYFALMKLPGVAGIRGVTRLIIVLLLPLAIATAQVLHLSMEKLQRSRPRFVTPFMIIMVIWLFAENRTNPYRFLKDEGRQRVRALQAQFPEILPENAVLAYVYPVGGDERLYEVDAMLAAQDKNMYTMNGYSAAAPNGYRNLRTCTDIKISLDDIVQRNESLSLQNIASRMVTVGTPVDGPCGRFLGRQATIASALPDEAFQAGIEVIPPTEVDSNADFMAEVRITNQSPVLWRVKGVPEKFAMRVSCQWLGARSQVLMDYPNRFDLPYDLAPNETASVAVTLKAPSTPGAYTLECDAIQELIHWFHSMGSKTGKSPVQIRGASAAPVIQAFLDLVDDQWINGWAWDSAHPESSLRVELRDGDKPLGIVEANVFRKDLLDAGIGTGAYSFSFPNPIPRDGKSHSVHAFVAGTDIELAGSPKAFMRSR
jgi:hypothetical protein